MCQDEYCSYRSNNIDNNNEIISNKKSSKLIEFIGDTVLYKGKIQLTILDYATKSHMQGRISLPWQVLVQKHLPPL